MKTKYRNTAFLVELIINILVFSISCVVLVGLFGKAAEIASRTQEQSRAATELEYLVESVKAGGIESISPHPDVDGDTQTATLYYAGQLGESVPAAQPVFGSVPRYTVTVSVSGQATGAGALRHITATAYTGLEQAVLYTLSTAGYTPDENR